MAITTQPRLSDHLLADVVGEWRGIVTATQPGVVAGLGLLDPTQANGPVGRWKVLAVDGDEVAAGTALLEVIGTASELGAAEDYVVGPLGFASGIATRARQFRQACPPRISLACGGWKKLPVALKPALRAGLAVAGVLPRLVEGDFIYVNKNAVRMIGNVQDAIAAGIRVGHGPVAIQVKDVDEALFAARAGAGIVMVDTGRIADLADVHRALSAQGLRDRVTLAFGGGVRLQDLEAVENAGAQAVDVGRAILDAPLLDLRFEVFSR